jgi:hypothetical protein
MNAFHDIATLGAFLFMLFSPCLSAYRVTVTWDAMDAAYFRFEASVARMLEPMLVSSVESNLCIHPRGYPRWGAGQAQQLAMPDRVEARLPLRPALLAKAA